MGTIDISAEIDALQNAVYGEEVRGAFISCMKKIHEENQYYNDLKDAIDQTQAAIEELEASIDTKAEEVAASIKNASDMNGTLTATIASANTMNTTLTATNETATATNTTLQATNQTATETNTTLQATVDEAKAADSDIAATVKAVEEATATANEAAEKASAAAEEATAAVLATTNYITFSVNADDLGLDITIYEEDE